MAQQRKRGLHAVTENDKPPAQRAKPKPKTLKAAADSSERALLVKMRDDISDAIAAGVPPHTLAPLMRQLRDIDKEIRLLDARAVQESEEKAEEPVDSTFDASAI